MHVLFSLFLLGLAKRVGARLLLASTSEVYGGKWRFMDIIVKAFKEY